MAWTLGIIGGSGLYDVDGLDDPQWVDVESPLGKVSDAILCAELHGVRLRFLPRHGRGHRLLPGEVDYRANIDALKRAGCTDLVSLSAVGSLRESFAPGDFVAVNQFIDRTRGRASTFFGEGVVAHVSLADPVCSRLLERLADAAEAAGATVHRADMLTYLAMEGPQFSTRAESELYRSWGCDVIGMTNMPEAKLAREAELPYATLGMVTDYDCWHDGHGAVEVADVLAVLSRNAATAARTVAKLARTLAATPRTPSPQGIETCLDTALLTPPEAQPPETKARLSAVLERVNAARALSGFDSP